MVRVVLVGVFLCTVLWVAGGLLGTLSSYIVLPVYGIRHWIAESTAPLPAFIRSRTELMEEIHTLKEKVSAQGGNAATIARLSAEGEVNRQLLGITDSEKRIAAGVVARPPGIPYDLLLIDRGRKDGVLERAVVYYAEDQAIGIVSKVFDESALVMLFSSPNMHATAYLFGPDIFVEMFGEGGGIVRLSIPQGVSVEQGNPVVLPGVGAGIIGVVTHITSIATEPEQRAYVTLPAPIQSIYAVGVSTRAFAELSYAEAREAIAQFEYHGLDIDIPEQPTTTPGGVPATTTVPNP